MAERSGFMDAGPMPADFPAKEEDRRLEDVCVPLAFDLQQFDTVCQMEEASLANGFGHGRSFLCQNAEKKTRNLEGLVSIEVMTNFGTPNRTVESFFKIRFCVDLGTVTCSSTYFGIQDAAQRILGTLAIVSPPYRPSVVVF
jgi:hypothetical protein